MLHLTLFYLSAIKAFLTLGTAMGEMKRPWKPSLVQYQLEHGWIEFTDCIAFDLCPPHINICTMKYLTP